MNPTQTPLCECDVTFLQRKRLSKAWFYVEQNKFDLLSIISPFCELEFFYYDKLVYHHDMKTGIFLKISTKRPI